MPIAFYNFIPESSIINLNVKMSDLLEVQSEFSHDYTLRLRFRGGNDFAHNKN